MPFAVLALPLNCSNNKYRIQKYNSNATEHSGQGAQRDASSMICSDSAKSQKCSALFFFSCSRAYLGARGCGDKRL